MIRLTLTCLLALAAASAVAQPLDLEVIARQPDTEVIRRTENGSEVVEIRRGGVTINLKDGLRNGFDNSGHGAIWCNWELIVGAKIAADVCFPGEFAEVSSLLGEQIGQLDDFIVANSLTPVSKADLKDLYDSRASSIRPGNEACLNPRRYFLEPLKQRLQSTPRADVERQFEQVLAPPRPPVINPCL
jgi:hypothetical protein